MTGNIREVCLIFGPSKSKIINRKPSIHPSSHASPSHHLPIKVSAVRGNAG
jgi:hypothetical protein